VNEIARGYFVNVQNAVGEQTYEPVYSLLKRAVEASGNRPIIIYYVSDYDPRGEMTMPIAVARKIEWMVKNLEEFKGLNVKLKKILLTQDQVIQYNLPPAPVKETEAMKGRWESLRGNYVVELDAMEQLRPVEMVEIIKNEIERYIPSHIIDAIEAYNDKVSMAIQEYNKQIGDIVRQKFESIEESIEEKIREIFKDFRAQIIIDVSDPLEKLKSVIDEWEEPEWEVDLNDDWLFDSERQYLSQLKHYRKVRG